MDPLDRGALVEDLLERTSRTFALAIPLLPEPLRREVGVGYLLFRIADTLEDAERWPRDQRIAELRAWTAWLATPSITGAESLANRWASDPPSTNDDYNRLLGETPTVAAELLSLEAGAIDAVARHAARSAEGMARTLAESDPEGRLRLTTIEELRRYCYYVAGIVGEMLTELFARRLDACPARDALAADSTAFGEGLQLVNILKDAPDDAIDGRVYLPSGVDRSAVFELAREDLRAAERYAENLQAAGADGGVVAFATLPRTLAEETLATLASTGARKVTREVVAERLDEAQRIAQRRGA
ncbi:MAG: squalene/phytoene synthase family protein [Planctomycetota bacterium]